MSLTKSPLTSSTASGPASVTLRHGWRIADQRAAGEPGQRNAAAMRGQGTVDRRDAGEFEILPPGCTVSDAPWLIDRSLDPLMLDRTEIRGGERVRRIGNDGDLDAARPRRDLPVTILRLGKVSVDSMPNPVPARPLRRLAAPRHRGPAHRTGSPEDRQRRILWQLIDRRLAAVRAGVAFSELPPGGCR